MEQQVVTRKNTRGALPLGSPRNGRKWTTRRAVICWVVCDCINKGTPIIRICKSLQITQPTIHNLLREVGYPKNGYNYARGIKFDPRPLLAVLLRTQGQKHYSNVEIGYVLGVSETTIRRWLKKGIAQ